MTEPFNAREHLMMLKSKEGPKEYLPVQYRLVWFREACPQGTIETEEMQIDLDREMEEEAFAWNAEKKRSEKVIKRAKGYARFKATVTDGKGGRATGTKSECAASFPDYIEKAETGAIGRALAALGYGTQFAPEFNEEHRIVDAPVERDTHVANGSGNHTSNAAQPQQTAPTPLQVAQAVKDKLKAVAQKAVALGKATDYKSFYQWAGTELAMVANSANLTMDNLNDLDARLDRLSQQSERKAS